MKIIKLKHILWLFLMGFSLATYAQLNFGNTPLPSRLGNASNWQLNESASDDFEYTFNPTNNNADFGPVGLTKWNNFFHNPWEGPGATKWVRNHVSVSGGNLNLWASRRFFNNNTNTPYTKTFDFDFGDGNGIVSVTRPETLAGCITSKERVIYPVFVEASLRVMNSSLATDIWLLSPDDKEEIDIIECYGGGMSDGRNNFFAERVHLSHHVFVRPPNFRDYQPSDWNSWYRQSGVNKWGGRVVRIGVYWKSPTIIEYYLDGELIRVLDNDAIASRVQNGTWEYTYPAGVTSTDQNGQLVRETSGIQNGFQKMVVSSTSNSFNQNNLDVAKSQSNISVLDPFNYLNNGRKFSREMDIIINVEDQSWQAAANRSPNNSEMQNFNDNLMLVDWIRVLKPSGSTTGGSSAATCDTAPDYNDNANSYSPGDRVINGGILYERTVNGWNQIEDCNVNSGGNIGEVTCNNAPAYNGNANSYSSGERVINGGVLYERTSSGWNVIDNCINCSNAPTYNGNANSYSPGDRVLNGGTLYERTASGWNIVQNCNASKRVGVKSKNDELSFKVGVYPNPAEDFVNILLEDITVGLANVRILDMQGKVIYKNKINDSVFTINTSNFSKGLYIVEVKMNEENLVMKKLVIE
ncbi:T9SS type A sorting domain-containing protein [Seonamhaeicola algicola]|uniref:T9SS type A sorting domain-containing protein n=1 Tax=Seonamhaeicola algicola TaxID=1719036 RepID=A0A5C7AVH5_9FLAO|nr:T9SS type A sorting domain-containing protein [Seonamhaeicola algicola]TXE12786.1 T9SS type A sorting domain-containing protein [Seonamhaeicola algicola]